MGLWDRVGSYAKKRTLSEGVSTGWASIQKNSQDMSLSGLSVGNLRTYWRGPETQDQGRQLYASLVAPQFKNVADADAFAHKLRLMGLAILVLAFIVGLSAVFISGFVFKLSALIGFLLFALTGTANFHRAQQIKEKRLFGLKEIFV